MNSREKTRLQKLLAGMSGNERQPLYKQAAKLRKSSQRSSGARVGSIRGRSDGEGLEEELPSFEKLSRGPSDSLDDWVLRLLHEEGDVVPESAAEVAAETFPGRVVSVGAGHCTVLHEEKAVACLLRPELAVAQQTDLAVGDEVRFSVRDDGEGMVEAVLPRRTTLSRRDPFYRHIERVIAANIDAAVIVVSVVSPPLHPTLIDRYLIAIERGGAEPLICVNKMDLLSGGDAEGEMAKLRPYRELGIGVIPCSASDGHGIDGLLTLLAGKLCVFVGHSGVGKSSLLNAIHPELNLETNTLRVGDGKGRHTTTASQLYELPHGVRVIDTPGIREFGLWKLSLEEVRWYFAEFADTASGCRFSDCSHIHEPGCAVKRAVDRGRIAGSRYESYRRIVQSM